MAGTVLYFGVRELFRNAESWYLILMGAIAFGTMMLAPQGIWGQIIRRYKVAFLTLRRSLPTGSTSQAGL